jgi:hypothetical protein
MSSFVKEPTHRTPYPISSVEFVMALLANLQPPTIMSGALNLTLISTVFTFTLPPGPVPGIGGLQQLHMWSLYRLGPACVQGSKPTVRSCRPAAVPAIRQTRQSVSQGLVSTRRR